MPEKSASANGQAKGSVLETPADITDAMDHMHEQFSALREQLAGIIVGQEDVSEQLLWVCCAEATAFCKGCLGWQKPCSYRRSHR